MSVLDSPIGVGLVVLCGLGAFYWIVAAVFAARYRTSLATDAHVGTCDKCGRYTNRYNLTFIETVGGVRVHCPNCMDKR